MWTCEPENKMLTLGSPDKDYMMNNEDVGNSNSDDESAEGDGTGGSELEDSDYMQGDDDASGDDEEANEFMMNARIQRKNPAAVVAISHKVSIPEVLIHESSEENGFLDDFDPPMVDSSEEASYENDDDGEGIRRKSGFIRYDSKAVIPNFYVGMTFSGRVQFKQALIKYGLATQRHLSFSRDEKHRIRAKCSWKGCPWFIFASNKTNSDRF
ncbi:hypothetical protein C2845_PM11G05280 [Panicum miliaceum]|uniref:Transposase MuDR plant domain-containing protein n=1 Tax=Panicum miliaceum TaxID=4540 RepID=A0A3L6RWQ4_PANMI|nr:hypothetical protein C2845_PM11G05280 [Panicum miliaceum]